jgi:hypothetical protein
VVAPVAASGSMQLACGWCSSLLAAARHSTSNSIGRAGPLCHTDTGGIW